MSRDIPFKSEAPKGPVARQDFHTFGLEDLAYVKPVVIEGQQLHAVHAADGTPLTVLSAREIAFATVRQHEMEPMSVH